MKIKDSVREIMAPFLSPRLAARTLQIRQQVKFGRLYGDFHIDEDFSAIAVTDLPNESGGIRGEIVHIAAKLKGEVKSVLLPGEGDQVKTAWAELLGLDATDIITAGLSDQADFKWNFGDSPLSYLGPADCIVS